MTGVVLVLVYFLLAGAAAVVLLAPKRLPATRSAVIDAPPNVVFGHIDTLQNWEAWLPWAKPGPSGKNDYAGPASGAGAALQWSATGAKEGLRRVAIVESRPSQKVVIKLEVGKPVATTSEVSFTLAPDVAAAPSRGGWWFSRLLGFGPSEADRTRTLVTWTVSPPDTLASRVLNFLQNWDKPVAEQFEKGLANLQAIVEK
jgi:hypothetical protein